MSLRDELAATNSAPQAGDYGLPAGWQPSVTYDASGRAEVVSLGTGQPGDESTWTEEVRALGVDIPPGWSVRLTHVSHDPGAWVRHAQGEDAVTEAVTRRKYVVEPARAASLDIDELISGIGKKRPRVPDPVQGGWAYVHCVSDWQLGKVAYGVGSDQAIEVVLSALTKSVKRIKAQARSRPVDTILIAGLGDLCEGHVSQGGASIIGADLTLTEQLRIVRRLLLEHVKQFAPLANRVVLGSAPGNHDESYRILNSKPRADDSFAVEAAVQVADALHLAGGYEHVETVVPDIDDLTVTVEVAGSVIGLAHGHQMRHGKAHEWWAKMAHARHRIGQADILLTGHFHHLRIVEESGRTHIQSGAVDNGSPWFDQKHGGIPGPSGVVTFYTKEGTWTGLELL